MGQKEWGEKGTYAGGTEERLQNPNVEKRVKKGDEKARCGEKEPPNWVRKKVYANSERTKRKGV